MKIKTPIISLLMTLFICTSASAQWDWLKKKINTISKDPVESIKQTALSETEIGQGLKEALKVGIKNAVVAAGEEGGYFNNEDIKITLPRELKILDTTLRKLGMSNMIDDFVLSMNQAAESAAPSALDIFLDALFEMNIEDAEKLFQGTDTAATDYFKDKTYDKLALAFHPTIDKALERYDVTDKYNTLFDKYKTIPFASKISMLSPDEYVIEKALDGLFFILGEEEANIRKNPAARVTDILQKVFK